jgi:catechol 2,3-dioxygenase-like lactoylglutathione lyase family enzyme
MRLDHIAYRTFNRDKTVAFFMEAFGYKKQAEFEIFFNDEKTDKALCIALEPPEKINPKMPFTIHHIGFDGETDYHMAPEIFVSEGTPGSIVWNWVQARGGIGGIHHIAYEVPDVEAKRKEWIEKGWGDFTSKTAFKCDDLTQIFTVPHSLTGMVYEFIERKGHGFCAANVLELMRSTAKIDKNIP